MLYLVKVISAWLLPPGIFILAALALAIYGKRKINQNKVVGLIAAFAVFLYLLSCPIIARLLVTPLENAYKPAFEEKADIIVVLGGGAASGTESLGGKGSLTGSGANRLVTGAQLHHRIKRPLLINGGQVYSNSGNEALIGKRILVNLGIAEESIILDTKARNTKENARYSVELCEKRGYKRIMLVTSAFHMPRSMLCFQKATEGKVFSIIPIPCDYLLNTNNEVNVFSFTPSLEAFVLNALALHEYLGILAMKA